jgi:hypothetical protein
MAKAFLNEVDPFDENNESREEESLSKDINCDDSIKTSTPKLSKTPVAEYVKPSTLNTSDVKTTDNKATRSNDFEVVDSVTKTVDVLATISKTKGVNATTSKAIKTAPLCPIITESKATESNAADSMSTKATNREDADIKPKKRFTKPDQLVDAGPALTKRQKKKLEQQMLLKESIRVREETQFVSGLCRRRHHEAGKEEKDDSATSSVVSTPSIPELEIVRSSIPELPKAPSKDNHVENLKPKKANKKFKKLDLNDFDTLKNAIHEKSEPAWANEKPGVHSVADEVAKLFNESSESKLVSKNVVASKVSSTPSPVNVSPKEESVALIKETVKMVDTKPDTKAKAVPKLISRDTPTDVVKEVIEQASSSFKEKEKPSVKVPTKIAASKSSEKKVTSEKAKTKEVKPVVKETKSNSPVSTAASISKKTKSAKQKKESPTGESNRSAESALIGQAGLDLDENDELIDTIVDPEFIEDLVNKTLQSTSSTLASLFDSSPQFITQDSPTFSSSEFESYTPDTDITAEELSLDALCKLLTPHIEIKGDVSLEQAEECLRQSRKMLESLETSFVNTVKETTTVCKNIKKADKK